MPPRSITRARGTMPAGWLPPDGLAHWRALGGGQTVAGLADLVSEGQERVAGALGVPLERLPAVPAPAMRLVPLHGVLSDPGEADTFYEALSRERVEVAPVHFAGTGYLRMAAALHNTSDDYDRLADAVRELLKRR